MARPSTKPSIVLCLQPGWLPIRGGLSLLVVRYPIHRYPEKFRSHSSRGSGQRAMVRELSTRGWMQLACGVGDLPLNFLQR